MPKSSRSPSSNSGSPALAWSDVFNGLLPQFGSGSHGSEGPVGGVYIKGKISELLAHHGESISGGNAATFSELARRVCDVLQEATKTSGRVSFQLGKELMCVHSKTDERDWGVIQGKLESTLQRSSQAKLAAEKQTRSLRSGDLPSWLNQPLNVKNGELIYDKGAVFNPDKTPAIWRAFERYLAGDSIELVADYLQEKGLPTPASSDAEAVWSGGKVGYQLSSCAVIGLPNSTNPDLRAAKSPSTPQYPALLSWPTFRLVQDLLHASPKGGRRDPKYLLSGKVFCNLCKHGDGSDVPMNPVRRGGGIRLVCKEKGAAHHGPLNEEFESELLKWLQSREDIASELDHLLDANDQELEVAMNEFVWPRSLRHPHQSLEEVVRELRSSGRQQQAGDTHNGVDAFLGRLKSEPKGSERRKELRRKMRNVLRRHIDQVYLGAAPTCTKDSAPEHGPVSIQVNERDAIPMRLLTPQQLAFQRDMRSGLQLFDVVVHRVGQSGPDTEFQLALSTMWFELPPDADWEQILLSPQKEVFNDSPLQESTEADIDSDESDGTPAGAGLPDPEGAADSDRHSSVLASSARADYSEHERTGYQSHSDASSLRPRGVHICSTDLDDLGDHLYKLIQVEAPRTLTQSQADHLAFGMLLSSLDLFARLDDWLAAILGRTCNDEDETLDIHRRVFREVCPADGEELDINSLDLETARVLAKQHSGVPTDLSLIFASLFKGPPRGSMTLATKLAADLEGLRWAQDTNGRSIRHRDCAEMARTVLLDGSSKEYFLAHPLSLYFEEAQAWKWLAAGIRRRIKRGLHNRTGGLAKPWRTEDLRRAVQAQPIPAIGAGSRPARVYLHGVGRVARKLRSAFGI